MPDKQEVNFSLRQYELHQVLRVYSQPLFEAPLKFDSKIVKKWRNRKGE